MANYGKQPLTELPKSGGNTILMTNLILIQLTYS